MADTEFTVPAVVDGKPIKRVIPPVDGFNEDPGNHQDIFGLAIVVCVEECPAKRTSYDFKDSY